MSAERNDGSDVASEDEDDTCGHVHGEWREGISASKSRAIATNTEDLLAVGLTTPCAAPFIARLRQIVTNLNQPWAESCNTLPAINL